MAYFGNLEEQENFENEGRGGIVEEVPSSTLKDFLEESYDQMFSREETAIIIYAEGRPCFSFIERRFTIEC
jgi:hypothetical protein